MRPATLAPLAALALIASAAFAPALAQAPMTRDLTVEQRPMADLVVPASGLKVDVWVDRRDQSYRPGDSVKIAIRTNEDAYVSIINVGSSGKSHVIFPNKIDTQNKVTGLQVLELPASGVYRFAAGGPPGLDLIKVIATRKPHRITPDNRLVDAGPFQTYQGTAAALARDLTLELKEHGPDRPEAGAGVAEAMIRILPAQ